MRAWLNENLGAYYVEVRPHLGGSSLVEVKVRDACTSVRKVNALASVDQARELAAALTAAADLAEGKQAAGDTAAPAPDLAAGVEPGRLVVEYRAREGLPWTQVSVYKLAEWALGRPWAPGGTGQVLIHITPHGHGAGDPHTDPQGAPGTP